MQSMLHIQALNKSFGSLRALDNVNLNVPENRIYGLVGLNGAGKTTLIKCILDLQRADAGEIRIQDNISVNSVARNDLVYLPERFSPPDYMQGETYLRFILDTCLAGERRQEAAASISAIAGKLDFPEEALKKPVKKLSKGMAQKLGIMGCLLSGKSLWILDEPMSGLDPKARALFKTVLRELKQNGKTVLLCSHILNDIETLCDEVSVLHEGEIFYSGTPKNCCEQYATTDFESAFLKCLENH